VTPDPTVNDLLQILRRRSRFIFGNVIALTLIALGVSLILPKWYSARAVLLPPTEDDIGSSMAQFMPRGLGGAFRLPGQTTLADVFVAELKSRTLADRIVQRFDLVRRYHVPDQEKAVLALEDHVRFKVGDEGTIAIVVEDRDPKTAANMANAYVEELDRFNLETRTTSAKRTRAFIDQRLTVVKHDLAAAEDGLRAYQQAHKLPAMSPSDKSDADVGANLMARKIALEVRLQVLRQSLAESSGEVRRVREELAAIDRQVGGLPQAGLEIIRLWREVKVQEQVFELLTAQLEEARIRETRDTPTVEVLDHATTPLHKSRPKRWLVVAAGFLVGLAGSVTAALLLERRTALPSMGLLSGGGAASS
jgi:tyrosine-protein kinase Etk/Wzc